MAEEDEEEVRGHDRTNADGRQEGRRDKTGTRMGTRESASPTGPERARVDTPFLLATPFEADVDEQDKREEARNSVWVTTACTSASASTIEIVQTAADTLLRQAHCGPADPPGNIFVQS